MSERVIAVITERYPDGRAKAIRSSLPITPELNQRAEELDSRLAAAMREVTRRLEKQGLIQPAGPTRPARLNKGGVSVWYEVGKTIQEAVEAEGVGGARERRWLFEALENLHAPDRLKRAGRGRTRTHLEYCYRLAQFPKSIALQMNWSEWVYFFDSLTLRGETRADRWLAERVANGQVVERACFRQFTQQLNKRVARLDTSVLTDAELFRIYDSVWDDTFVVAG